MPDLSHSYDSPSGLNDSALRNLPCYQYSICFALKACRERLFYGELFSILIALRHGRLVDIGEQWLELLDLIFWLLEKFGDSDRIVE